DPFTKKPVYVARNLRDRKLQRALMQFFKPENYFGVRKALEQAGRQDLIGSGCDALIPAQPPRAALSARRREANRGLSGDYVHTIANPNTDDGTRRGENRGYRRGRKSAQRSPRTTRWGGPAMSSQVFPVATEDAGTTLAAFLRTHLPDRSWSQVRRLIAGRRAKIGGELCLDPARRVTEGESVELLASAAVGPRREQDVVIRHLDPGLVVVEKPPGISTVRHPAERDWNQRRKALSPTLEDI